MVKQDRVEAIANAVLYEGYMLYPYRPSALKNRHRFNFGVAYPPAYCGEQSGTEVSQLQTECLLLGDAETTVDLKVRFLQLVQREVVAPQNPLTELPLNSDTPGSPVERLEVEGKIYQPWQEAIERDVCLPACRLRDILNLPLTRPFSFPGNTNTETIRDSAARIAGVIVRRQQSVLGEVQIGAETLNGRATKVTACIRNTSEMPEGPQKSRDFALFQSLVSAHMIFRLSGGEFLSLIDPPDAYKDSANQCRNAGMWPVLVGQKERCDTVLSSPIILYDYPEIAPESAGDLFDGTEIDEILALRILTLTDEEKKEAQNTDERTRFILERTEALAPEHFAKLHGVLRDSGPSKREAS